MVRISVPEAKQLGYFYETKKNRVILHQYNCTVGLFKFPHYNDFKLSCYDVVPFGTVVLDDADWERF